MSKRAMTRPPEELRECTKRKAPQTRFLPRVSAAKGGLLPGVDLDASSSLQKLDDLAYLKRFATDPR